MKQQGFWRLLFIALTLLLFASLAFAQEEKKEGVTDDDLDNLLRDARKPATDEAKAKKEKKRKEAKEEKSFPVDERKLKVTIKMKNGKTFTGVVKHFLQSGDIEDHLSDDYDWMLAEGPTVQHNRNEFTMNWDKIKKIELDKSNKENGESSCVEVTDISPDRMECIMINQYNAYAKDKKSKGAHKIINKDLFRFVVDTGKETVNVDGHLGKVKITNARDESRREKKLYKELQKVFADGILWIKFH